MSIDNASVYDWNMAWKEQRHETELSNILRESLARNGQVEGNHYQGTQFQSWDVFLDWGLDPWACNVIKYIQRHRKKGGKVDLEKAAHYLQFMIENYDKIGKQYYK